VGQHDRSYRSLFSFPRMVEDLIRQFVPESWVGRLDFSTLQRVTPSYISDEIENQPEELWELRLQDGSPVYIYLFIEDRSEVDRFLAVHLMARIALLYQALLQREKLTPEGLLPLVIPIVLHHGDTEPKELSELIARVDVTAEAYIPQLRCGVINEGRFLPDDLESRQGATAKVFLMERSRDWEVLRHGARSLGSFVVRSKDHPLHQALLDWVDEMMIARWQEKWPIPKDLDSEDFLDRLAEALEARNRILN
jgi:hypothetical protein